MVTSNTYDRSYGISIDSLQTIILDITPIHRPYKLMFQGFHGVINAINPCIKVPPNLIEKL